MTMQNIENTLEKCLKIEHLEFMKFYDDKLSLKYEIWPLLYLSKKLNANQIIYCEAQV